MNQIAQFRSEYRGLLPKHFPPGILPETTRAIPTDMNDMNREERSRYVNPTSCNFIIDTEGIETTMLEPNYRNIVCTNLFLHLVKICIMNLSAGFLLARVFRSMESICFPCT